MNRAALHDKRQVATLPLEELKLFQRIAVDDEQVRALSRFNRPTVTKPKEFSRSARCQLQRLDIRKPGNIAQHFHAAGQGIVRDPRNAAIGAHQHSSALVEELSLIHISEPTRTY